MKWQNKLIDLIEKELKEFPKEKGCYINDMLILVEDLLLAEKKKQRTAYESVIQRMKDDFDKELRADREQIVKKLEEFRERSNLPYCCNLVLEDLINLITHTPEKGLRNK